MLLPLRINLERAIGGFGAAGSFIQGWRTPPREVPITGKLLEKAPAQIDVITCLVLPAVEIEIDEQSPAQIDLCFARVGVVAKFAESSPSQGGSAQLLSLCVASANDQSPAQAGDASCMVLRADWRLSGRGDDRLADRLSGRSDWRLNGRRKRAA